LKGQDDGRREGSPASGGFNRPLRERITKTIENKKGIGKHFQYKAGGKSKTLCGKEKNV